MQTKRKIGDFNDTAVAKKMKNENRNPLIIVQENYPKLIYKFNNSYNEVVCTVELNGVTYQGFGNSQILAKENVASKIVSLLNENLNNSQNIIESENKLTKNPVQNIKNKLANVPKNPVSILNEIHKGLNYQFLSAKGPTNCPIFKVEVEFQGIKYFGEGRSKNLAKHNVAKNILNVIDPERQFECVEISNNAPILDDDNQPLKNNISAEKNPVSVLNELRAGLIYNFVSVNGPSHAPTFEVTVEVDGQIYKGSGRSKKLAKTNAAEAALRSFIQFPYNKGIHTAPDNAHCDFTRDSFEKIEKKKRFIAEKAGADKGAVMQLNEVFPDAKYEYFDTEGDVFSRFKVTVNVNGKIFTGQGSSKKLAKQAAAATALSRLLQINTSLLTNNSPRNRRRVVSPEEQEMADTIGRLINEKFANLMANDMIYSKRKVLAGIVMIANDNLATAEVICLATGTKCISGSYMSLEGMSLNDLHAEIVARRCLISYFYDQIFLLLSPETQQDSIFTKDEKGVIRLKPGIDFHLFINTAPCGDARIFSPHEEEKGDRHPNRISRGQLRTKIESGEGTIPVKKENAIQTWDGVLQGERLLTMSCSDKICKWNVLGVQGALLANIIEPIYLKSIVLGSLLHDIHLHRAISGRIENTLQGLPPPYKLNRPSAYLVTSSEIRFPCKAPNFSVNWVKTDDSVEIVSTISGKLENKMEPSKLCKSAFLRKYHQIAKQLGTTKLNSTVYANAKESSVNYQIAKRALYDAFKKANLGLWVSKPMEQDLFDIAS